MEENQTVYETLKDNFRAVRPERRLCVYLPVSIEASDEEISSALRKRAESGVGMVIPEVCSEDFDYIYPMRLLHVYGVLLENAEQLGIYVALNLEKPIERSLVRYFDDIEGESIRARVLLRREYFCSSEEEVHIPIDGGVISAVAIEEQGEICDLRPYINNSVIEWKAPRGNWRVCRFFCDEDTERDGVNMLSYDASCRYLEAVFGLFSENFSRHMGRTLRAVVFSDVGFSSRNHRDWDESFNEIFSEMYGADASPLYPYLYYFGENRRKDITAALMDCRARLLRDGFMKAVSDVSAKYGMLPLGSLSEPKVSACSLTVGDAMLVQSEIPCAVLEKAYLYGINSVLISAGASLLSGNGTVACDIFRGYENLTRDVIRRETMTALSRGVNFFMAHLPENFPPREEKNGLTLFIEKSEESKYADIVARLQNVLCGGEKVADFALLYPIYQLHGEACLYDVPTEAGQYEYPDTPDTTDYMTVINSITAYSGHDLSVIHPSLMKKCRAENGRLLLPGENGSGFSVLVIPSTELISLDNLRMAAEFFDGGGKILATGVLPRLAFGVPERENGDRNAEIAELTKHIFGDGADDENITCDHIYNKNDAGGEAYFLYSTTTGSDRTFFVPSARLYDAVCAFDIPYDIFLEDMPRLECTGALNNNYPEYKMLGLASRIRGGGMLSHIHKKNGDCDVYFFSNATDMAYEGKAYLRGRLCPESWNPQSGKIRRVKCEYTERCGEIYTKIDMKIGVGEFLLIVSDGKADSDAEIAEE